MLLSQTLPATALVHFTGPGTPYETGLELFAGVLAKDAGPVLVPSYAKSGLTERDLLDAVAAGGMIGGVVTTGALGELLPGFHVADLPYVFTDAEHAARFWRGSAAAALIRAAELRGLVILAFYDAGTRHLFNSLYPVVMAQDVAGLRLRTMPNRYHRRWLESLGAETWPIASLSISESIRQGMIDGAERSFANYRSLDCFDVAPFISATGHCHLSAALVVSAAWWAGLDTATRTRARQAAAASETVERVAYRAQDAAAEIAMAEAGIRVTAPDLESFRMRALPLHQAFRAEEENGAALLEAAFSA